MRQQHAMLPIGTVLTHRQRKGCGNGRVIHAEVIKDSEGNIAIQYDNRIYTSMSSAAQAAAGHTANGWIYWNQGT